FAEAWSSGRGLAMADRAGVRRGGGGVRRPPGVADVAPEARGLRRRLRLGVCGAGRSAEGDADPGGPATGAAAVTGVTEPGCRCRKRRTDDRSDRFGAALASAGG